MRDLLFNVYKIPIHVSHARIQIILSGGWWIRFEGKLCSSVRGWRLDRGLFSVNLQSQFNKFQFSRGRFGLSHAPTPEIRDCMHHHIWIFLTANHSLLQQLLGKIYFKQIHCLILKPYKHHESQNSSSQLSQWFLISSALHKQVTLIEFVAYWVRIH